MIVYATRLLGILVGASGTLALGYLYQLRNHRKTYEKMSQTVYKMQNTLDQVGGPDKKRSLHMHSHHMHSYHMHLHHMHPHHMSPLGRSE